MIGVILLYGLIIRTPIIYEDMNSDDGMVVLYTVAERKTNTVELRDTGYSCPFH